MSSKENDSQPGEGGAVPPEGPTGPAPEGPGAPSPDPSGQPSERNPQIPRERPGDIEQRIPREGRLLGDRYVAVRREDQGDFRRGSGGMLFAAPTADEPKGGAGRVGFLIKRRVLGPRLPSSALEGERLPIRKALPTLASDALSSVAYGPEAGLTVLAMAGAGALAFDIPVAIAIAALMILVVLSYRQVVLSQADGGSYAIARDHLGQWPAMVAAAALLIDYVLTVSVSVSSGADAVASAFPSLVSIRLPLALILILLICAGNLRGVREAGSLFSLPTYLFIVCITALIGFGLVHGLTAPGHHKLGSYPPIPDVTRTITPFLILTAFASGCSSMTGIEAVSNSVRSFRQPQGANAARTLMLLGGLLVFLFLGVTALDVIFGVEPRPSGNPTVLAQIAERTFYGPSHWFFFVIQLATMMVLVLAANASFNGFPRLCAFLARDNRLPHRFGAFGDRLVYSTAIIFLTVVSALVVVIFNAGTDRLINLYAIGVFTAFTLAQAALVRWGLHRRGPHWRRNLAVNGSGMVATAVVDVIVMVVKFRLGAWAVLIIVPLLLLLFWFIGRHYQTISDRVHRAGSGDRRLRPYKTLVPVRELNLPTKRALAYALTLGVDVIALNLGRRPELAQELASFKGVVASAEASAPSVKLEVAEPLRRRALPSLLALLDQFRQEAPDGLVTVLVPDRVTSTGMLGLMGSPHALRLKAALLARERVVTASYPAEAPDKAARRALPAPRRRVAIVPVSGLDVLALRALRYAQEIADEVVAVHVATGQLTDSEKQILPPGQSSSDPVGVTPSQEGLELERRWDVWATRFLDDQGGPHPQLVVLVSNYRTVVQPVLRYLEAFREKNQDALCTVVLPELITRHAWNQILHNHRAFHIKAALLGRADFAVADVPYDLAPTEAS